MNPVIVVVAVLSVFLATAAVAPPRDYPALDTAQSVERHIPRLKAQGIKTVCRYFMRNSRWDKVITPKEARALAKAGIRVCVVYEGPGDKVGYFTYQNGVRDAVYSITQSAAIGQPPDGTVYFAVDFDASEADLRRNVIPYFQGILDTLRKQGSKLHVGVYGSGLVAKRLSELGLADHFWISCSTGWRGTKEFVKSGKWHILQHLPTKRYAGIDTDPDEFNPKLEDVGDFIPFQLKDDTSQKETPIPAPQPPVQSSPPEIEQTPKPEAPLVQPSHDPWFYEEWWKVVTEWWNK